MNWPYQKATEVKLTGSSETTLTELSFGGMTTYMFPEGQTLNPGEAYKLRVTVEGATFTSKKATRVLEPLMITTAEGQMEPGSSLTVEWNPVQYTAGYAVQVSSTLMDTTFLVRTATQKDLPGDLFEQNGKYDITVTAYEESMAAYLDQWVNQPQGANGMPTVYGFDDPNVLGMLFSMTADDVTVWVGTGGEDGGNIPTPGGQIDITVSGGLTPTFNWTGGNARILSVNKANQTADILWSILATSASGFASPVTYGQAPSGTMQVFPPQPLQSGTAYQVTITGLQALDIGTKQFTP